MKKKIISIFLTVFLILIVGSLNSFAQTKVFFEAESAEDFETTFTKVGNYSPIFSDVDINGTKCVKEEMDKSGYGSFDFAVPNYQSYIKGKITIEVSVLLDQNKPVDWLRIDTNKGNVICPQMISGGGQTLQTSAAVSRSEWNNIIAVYDIETKTVHVTNNGETIFDGSSTFLTSGYNTIRLYPWGSPGDIIYIKGYKAIYSDEQYSGEAIKECKGMYLKDKTLYGFGGMTVGEMLNDIVFDSDYDVTVMQNDKNVSRDVLAEEGMIIRVSKGGVFLDSYTLGGEYLNVDKIRLLSGGKEDNKFSSGSFRAEVQITAYNKALDVFLVLGLFDDSDRLIKVTLSGGSADNETKTVKCEMNIGDEGKLLRVFLLDKNSLKPIVKKAEIYRYNASLLYPGYTTKAVTFSYDDAWYTDIDLVNMFNKYGAKCTFNIIGSYLVNPSRTGYLGQWLQSEYGYDSVQTIEYIKNLYKGHELSDHGYNHLVVSNSNYSDSDIINDINSNQKYLKDILNVDTRGIAWSTGYINEARADTYENILDTLYQSGHRYARAKENGEFNIPENWMLWHSTCHGIDDALTEKYIALEDTGDLKVYYIWGHSYEFEDGKSYQLYSWDQLEQTLKKLSGANVYFATNGEIYDYIAASSKLIYTKNSVINNSDIQIYMLINGEKVSIQPKSEYTLN